MQLNLDFMHELNLHIVSKNSSKQLYGEAPCSTACLATRPSIIFLWEWWWWWMMQRLTSLWWSFWNVLCFGFWSNFSLKRLNSVFQQPLLVHQNPEKPFNVVTLTMRGTMNQTRHLVAKGCKATSMSSKINLLNSKLEAEKKHLNISKWYRNIGI